MKSSKILFLFLAVIVISFTLAACGGGGSGGGGNEKVVPGVSVDINQDFHKASIILNEDGTVPGFFSDYKLYMSEQRKMCFSSDTDGWGEDSAACVDLVLDGSRAVDLIIPNTTNKVEKGNWTIVDRNGIHVWADPASWKRTGITSEIIPAYTDAQGNIIGPFVKYGGAIVPTISIRKVGNAAEITVDFGCNKFDWMSLRFVIESLSVFTFRSNETGWDSDSWAKGVLLKDSDGDWVVTISGLPLGEVYGNVAADLSDGTTSWVAPELWNYGDNIGMAKDPANANVWLIRYLM